MEKPQNIGILAVFLHYSYILWSPATQIYREKKVPRKASRHLPNLRYFLEWFTAWRDRSCIRELPRDTRACSYQESAWRGSQRFSPR